MPRNDGVATPTVQRHGARGPMPDTLYVLVPGLPSDQAMNLAQSAVRFAQSIAPKMSGRSSRGLRPYYGDGYFGIRWLDSYVWYQEMGISAFTMRNLAGKTIPMWLDDPTGRMRIENPKAETRTTESGKIQVKVFRRVGKIGARKWVNRGGTRTSVPQSYPGAPGRIAQRTFNYATGGTTGRIALRQAQPNIGVRWRHPGLMARHFLHYSIATVAKQAGLGAPRIYPSYRRD